MQYLVKCYVLLRRNQYCISYELSVCRYCWWIGRLSSQRCRQAISRFCAYAAADENVQHRVCRYCTRMMCVMFNIRSVSSLIVSRRRSFWQNSLTIVILSAQAQSLAQPDVNWTIWSDRIYVALFAPPFGLFVFLLRLLPVIWRQTKNMGQSPTWGRPALYVRLVRQFRGRRVKIPLVATSRVPNAVTLAYTARAVLILGSHSWSVAFSIFDMTIHSGDIRDQSLKLSEIAPNFGRFLPSQILGVRRPQELCLNCYAIACLTARHVEKFREVTPSVPKVIGARTLNCRPIFTFIILKNCWGFPFSVSVG